MDLADNEKKSIYRLYINQNCSVSVFVLFTCYAHCQSELLQTFRQARKNALNAFTLPDVRILNKMASLPKKISIG